jgi:hypothetical protein
MRDARVWPQAIMMGVGALLVVAGVILLVVQFSQELSGQSCMARVRRTTFSFEDSEPTFTSLLKGRD